MIKVNCKEGVWFKFITYEFLVAAQIVYGEYAKQGITPTVTSACDGHHMEGSYHYKGLAWDFRIWGLYDPEAVCDVIKDKLSAIDYHYDVCWEQDHIHIEFDENKVRLT